MVVPQIVQTGQFIVIGKVEYSLILSVDVEEGEEEVQEKLEHAY